jgi:hypothetical protein
MSLEEEYEKETGLSPYEVFTLEGKLCKGVTFGFSNWLESKLTAEREAHAKTKAERLEMAKVADKLMDGSILTESELEMIERIIEESKQ